MTVEVPISEFLRKDNAALVHLLKTVQKAGGPDGVGTRKLCDKAFDSRSYGLKVIERAESENYIIRTGKRNKKGGGKKRVVKLTKKGWALLEQLVNS